MKIYTSGCGGKKLDEIESRDMGILVAKGRNGRSYPYLVIGIIESGKRNTAYGPWISKRANVIREVSNLSFAAMKNRHAL